MTEPTITVEEMVLHARFRACRGFEGDEDCDTCAEIIATLRLVPLYEKVVEAARGHETTCDGDTRLLDALAKLDAARKP